MPVFFRPFSYELPLTLESIGNNWIQEPVYRSTGFPLYHWLQTESGCGKIVVGGKEQDLKEGEGILIGPHIPHSYYRNAASWSTSFATFEGTLSSDIHKITGGEIIILVDAKRGKYFQKWIDRIIASHTAGQLDAATLSVECYDFFMHFAAIYKTDQVLEHPLYVQYVEPVIKEIELHYTDPVTVDLLASLVYITPQYLTRLFNRFTGSSVSTYLTSYRMNRAKELLIANPNLEIQHIYHRVGYSDVSHFISVFRQHTGTTPKQFRKLYGISR